MKVELKNVKMHVPQYDASMGFTADLYINGEKVGTAHNDGIGGPSDYHGDTKEESKLIREAESYFSSLPKENIADPGREAVYINQTLEYHITKLSFDHYNQTLLAKHMTKGILYGNNDYYQIFDTGKAISILLKDQKGEEFLASIIRSDILPIHKEGNRILNTNLPASLVDLINKAQKKKRNAQRKRQDKSQKGNHL
ncbi:hypothetical protein QFZ51_003518 [Chitinophaga sp. W3I9]|uniref:hypothetical protein n=1 Tax=Chitinophaga sp. W3I9 TaxID=3373924 RepID=UPI003D238C9A